MFLIFRIYVIQDNIEILECVTVCFVLLNELSKENDLYFLLREECENFIFTNYCVIRILLDYVVHQ